MATMMSAATWHRPTCWEILPRTALWGVAGGAVIGLLAGADTVVAVFREQTLLGAIIGIVLGGLLGWWRGKGYTTGGRVLAALGTAQFGALIGGVVAFFQHTLRTSFADTRVEATISVMLGMIAIISIAAIVGAIVGAVIGAPLGLVTGTLFLLVASLWQERSPRTISWICAALLAPCAWVALYGVFFILFTGLAGAPPYAILIVAGPTFLVTVFAWSVSSWLAEEM